MIKKIYKKLSNLLIANSAEVIEEGAEYPDIFSDKEFMEIYNIVKAYTMVGIIRSYALYTAVKYIIRKDKKGHFAECGVWRGGSCMLICLLLKRHGITDRQIYLYDTFEGMTRPGDMDGEVEMLEWNRQQGRDGVNHWCLADEDEVRQNMNLTGYPIENIHFIKGRVEDTIPSFLPQPLQLLRLDTDWYASTMHELKFLYPILSDGGFLIIDDYGAWPGAKKAVDEYFADTPVCLHRIDETGRIMVKTS